MASCRNKLEDFVLVQYISVLFSLVIDQLLLFPLPMIHVHACTVKSLVSPT